MHAENSSNAAVEKMASDLCGLLHQLRWRLPVVVLGQEVPYLREEALALSTALRRLGSLRVPSRTASAEPKKTGKKMFPGNVVSKVGKESERSYYSHFR